MLSLVKRLIPAQVKRRAKGLLPGRYPAYCPICLSHHEEFWAFGRNLRPNALCPECHGLERHRFLWIFLKRHTNFQEAALRLLHFAPEPDFGVRLSHARRVRYVSVDLERDRRPSVQADITALSFVERSFDAIVCSHVLEHVPDDRQAMRELRRALRPVGWLVVQVPIYAAITDEDPSVTDPAVREQRFGQSDHVRMYGPDVADRLREAGFTVTVHRPVDVLKPGDKGMGIPESESPILLCRPS
jgi:hypothetical protein